MYKFAQTIEAYGVQFTLNGEGYVNDNLPNIKITYQQFCLYPWAAKHFGFETIYEFTPEAAVKKLLFRIAQAANTMKIIEQIKKDHENV